MIHSDYTAVVEVACLQYARMLLDFALGRGEFPGREPDGYDIYRMRHPGTAAMYPCENHCSHVTQGPPRADRACTPPRNQPRRAPTPIPPLRHEPSPPRNRRAHFHATRRRPFSSRTARRAGWRRVPINAVRVLDRPPLRMPSLTAWLM